MTEKTKITLEISDFDDKLVELEMSPYNREVINLIEDHHGTDSICVNGPDRWWWFCPEYLPDLLQKFDEINEKNEINIEIVNKSKQIIKDEKCTQTNRKNREKLM